MSMPTSSETPPHGEPAPHGAPASAPAPNAAPERPFGPASRATLRSQLADDLRQTPRRLWEDFQVAVLELLANVAVAAVVVGVFALVGYAIGGSTGAVLAGVLGIGVFILLRVLVYAGMFVWGLGWLARAVRRP